MTHDPYAQQPGDDEPRDYSNQPDWGQQPSPHGQQYPYPQPQQDGKALTALILAIVGLFVCPIVLNVIALVLANQSLRAIRASNGWLTGEGMANAARIISIIALALVAIGILILIVGLVAFQGA